MSNKKKQLIIRQKNDSDSIDVITEDGLFVASIMEYPSDTETAALLKSAPEMLEVLKECADIFKLARRLAGEEIWDQYNCWSVQNKVIKIIESFE